MYVFCVTFLIFEIANVDAVECNLYIEIGSNMNFLIYLSKHIYKLHKFNKFIVFLKLILNL